MDDVEFYSKAQLDLDFRDRQIEECRYNKRIAIGFAVVSTAAWIGYVAFCAIAERRWPGDVGLGLGLMLCVTLYSRAQNRLAALQAMQSREPIQAPLPTSPAVTPAAAQPKCQP
jgi:hypothetical protein